MPRYTIRLVAIDGTAVATPEWVERFDPDAFDGLGAVDGTNDRRKARTFDTITEAWLCWNQVSTVRPVRPDGLPNRPLTTFTIAVEPLP